VAGDVVGAATGDGGAAVDAGGALALVLIGTPTAEVYARTVVARARR